MTHAWLTVAIAFPERRADAVEELLKGRGNPAGGAVQRKLGDLGMVHFMSGVAVREPDRRRAHLVLEIRADDDPKDAMRRIAHALEDELGGLLDAAGEPHRGRSLDGILLRSNLRLGFGWLSTAGIAFDGSPAMSVCRIRDEARLAEEVGGDMREVLAPGDPPLEKLREVRRLLWADEEGQEEPQLEMGLRRRACAFPGRGRETHRPQARVVRLPDADGAAVAVAGRVVVGFVAARRLLVGAARRRAPVGGGRRLFEDGVIDRSRFLRWARRKQVPVHFWYRAYPHLAMGQIRKNAAIRRGVAEARTDAEAADWLACLGGAPRPASALDKPEVPTLVFGGLSKLRHAHCLALSLPADNLKGARAWLDKVRPGVTFGEAASRKAMTLRLSAGGLRRLGVARTTSPPSPSPSSTAWRTRAAPGCWATSERTP